MECSKTTFSPLSQKWAGRRADRKQVVMWPLWCQPCKESRYMYVDKTLQ